MRTTVDLPDDLVIEAKKRAAELRCSLRSLFIDGLRRVLDQTADEPPARSKLEWVTVDGGLPPELDVTDREHMHDWLRAHR